MFKHFRLWLLLPALLPAAEALLASPRAAARAAGGRLVAGDGGVCGRER